MSTIKDLKAKRGTDTAYDQLVNERRISNRLEKRLADAAELFRISQSDTGCVVAWKDDVAHWLREYEKEA